MKTPTIQKKFGQKVKTLRVKKGWTQQELARRAELHRTYIGSIERSERNISLINMERIAKAFKVNIKDLL
ncbi:MAG: helix-turn-helix domain-containing protein [Planctomycetota bacterium]|jgi:transcriptional regulator with XRE-family HTH domain